jgi:O-antigen/teichoic acid export membrane protein
VFFCLCGLGVFLVSGTISLWLGQIFPKIEPEYLTQSRVAVLLIGLNMWIGFLNAFPPVILRSQDRFDLANAVEMVGLTVRAGLTVWVLLSGYGLIALGLVQICMTLVQFCFGYLLAKMCFPPLRISVTKAGLARLRELLSFSVFSFIANASLQLAMLADLALITWFLGPDQVAYYSVGLILVNYSQKLVGMAGGVIYPELIKQCGKGNSAEIQWLFRRAGDMKAFLGIGLWCGIIIFGREFMHNWMGSDYDISYWVVAILLIARLVSIVSSLAPAVISGLGQVKVMACVYSLQVAVNIALTVVFFLLGLGLPGAALGTTAAAIPAMIVTLIIVSRCISLNWVSYLRKTVIRWLTVALMYCGVSFAILKTVPQGGWGWFALKIALAATAYLPLAWVYILSREDRKRILRKIGLGGGASTKRSPYERVEKE